MTERVLPSGEPPTGQIAFVVRDLDVAVQRWIDLGIGPWNLWTFDEHLLRERIYEGGPGTFSARIGLCSLGPVTYELVQPLRGPSIWEGWITDEQLARPHHLGYYVDDIGLAVDAMEQRGYRVAQAGAGFGVDGDGAFAYFDTVADFGCYYEAIVGPRALIEPEATIT